MGVVGVSENDVNVANLKLGVAWQSKVLTNEESTSASLIKPGNMCTADTLLVENNFQWTDFI